MKCEGDKRKIYRWLDGEFKEAERITFEGHFQGCSACQREAGSSRAFRTLLQSSSLSMEPSSDFEPNFWKKVYARQHESWFSKLLKDIESLVPVPTLSQALTVFLMALLMGGTGGVVSGIHTMTPGKLEDQETSIKYLSGFREFKGVPSPSVAASYLKAVEERNPI